jgi:NAD(P)-dependent dehydrogenase (short-subunit alcohol dehydrogenase family)
MRRLEGKAVIVTGGGSGIGRGACLRIAEGGGYLAT